MKLKSLNVSIQNLDTDALSSQDRNKFFLCKMHSCHPDLSTWCLVSLGIGAGI